jgi:succinoglycan biosynthesis protein ExoA
VTAANTSSSGVMLTIIVACRNERRHIRTFLECLISQQLFGIEWEAIIADGMSDDGTRAILDGFSQQHRALRVVDNQGLIVSTGLNAALQAAGGNVIIRMDAHTRYSPDYCYACLEVLRATHADNVGGPALVEPGGTPMARAIAAAFQSPFSTGGARFHEATHEGFVDTVPYGCWRKETLQRLGGFDESLVRNQDDELNLRLIRAGGRIWQSSRMRSWYSPRPTVSQLFRQYLQYGFWKVAVIRKHGTPASWRHLVPVSFIVLNLAMLILMLIAPLATMPRVLYGTAVVWASVLGAYAIALVAASLITSARAGWLLLPYLPGVFAAYHLSYGIGFTLGLFRFWPPNASPAGSKSRLAQLTR